MALRRQGVWRSGWAGVGSASICSQLELLPADAALPQAISDIIRSTLGPRSMLKMLLDPMGIIMTNDGNSILREAPLSNSRTPKQTPNLVYAPAHPGPP